jgi:hypothetical protein
MHYTPRLIAYFSDYVDTKTQNLTMCLCQLFNYTLMFLIWSVNPCFLIVYSLTLGLFCLLSLLANYNDMNKSGAGVLRGQKLSKLGKFFKIKHLSN